MAAIFISYRRQDSRADAGRLTNDLKDHLDDRRIFRDIDTVEPDASGYSSAPRCSHFLVSFFCWPGSSRPKARRFCSRRRCWGARTGCSPRGDWFIADLEIVYAGKCVVSRRRNRMLERLCVE